MSKINFNAASFSTHHDEINPFYLDKFNDIPLNLRKQIKLFESYFGEETDKDGNIIHQESEGAFGIAINFQTKVKKDFNKSVYQFNDDEKSRYQSLNESCCLIIQEALDCMPCKQEDRLPRVVIRNLIWDEIEKASKVNYVPMRS